MSLVQSAFDYVGQLLCFEPKYGWGWTRHDARVPDDTHLDYEKVEQAGVFHLRIHRLFSFGGAPRGVIGRVEQAGHWFDGLWAVTYTMHVGTYDLTENLCARWDIELGAAQPSGDEWPTISEASPVYRGYGVLAVSPHAIAQWWRRTLEE